MTEGINEKSGVEVGVPWSTKSAEEIEVARLMRAVAAVYYETRWVPVKTLYGGTAARLWSELRDACGLEPGHSPPVVEFDGTDHAELSAKLRAVLTSGVSDDTVKAMGKKIEEITCMVEDDLMYRMKDDLAPNLVTWVQEMARRTVEALLEGGPHSEDQMRRYLSCDKRDEDGKYHGWTGRFDPEGFGSRNQIDQHRIIHGELHESGCIRLRRDIVNAHADLLKNERILDLEDQVKSLVLAHNKAVAEKDDMWRRLGHLEPRS